MARIQFELADKLAARKDLHALGAEFTAKSGKLHVDLPDVIESEALFLAVKAIVSHGAVSHAPEEERVTPEHTEKFAKEEENARLHPEKSRNDLEEYEREESKVSAAKTDKDAPRLSKSEAEIRQKADQGKQAAKPASEKDGK